MGRLEVSLKGLRRQVEAWPRSFILRELWQNAIDTQAKRVAITLTPVPGRKLVELTVEDDDPDGFKTFSHAWTMYAESEKVTDPEKAGRFNIGEKFVIALAHECEISTTTGTVRFEGDERAEYPRRKRERGSRFWGLFPLTREQIGEIELAAQSLIVPAHIEEATLNGVPIPRREPLALFRATLTTPVADDEGVLRPREREATVGVYRPVAGDDPLIYELGIPVCSMDCPWDINVEQKIPLNNQRDNVPAKYLQTLRVLVFNTMHDVLSEDEMRETWVGKATDDDRVEREAMTDMVEKRHGEDAVGCDPSDREAERTWQSKGGEVVYGGTYSKKQWEKLHEYGLLPPVGQVAPSPKPFGDGPPAEVVPIEEWTLGMKRLVAYVHIIAPALVGHDVHVTILRNFNAGAAYGDGRLYFNLKRLGRAWFDKPLCDPEILRLLIHELAHDGGAGHMEERYDKALAEIGAKLTVLALRKPELFNASNRSDGPTVRETNCDP
jgi:hypothetical protein